MSAVDVFKNSLLQKLPGNLVVRVEDAFGFISVIDDKNYRLLTFDTIFEQSKMRLSAPELPVHNYIKAMLMAFRFTSVQRVLVLGLGGGCLVRSLYACNNSLAIDVVELRAAVLAVARKYFFLPESDTIRYFTVDAATFIRQTEKSSYQLIFSDLYSADSMAPEQSMESFIQACADKLTPDGWLVLNYHELPRYDSPFSHALFRIFSTIIYCTAPSGNVVIYASPGVCALSLDKLKEKGKTMAEKFDCDFWPLAQKLAYCRAPGNQAPLRR